jgi:uncharacterized protein YukE
MRFMNIDEHNPQALDDVAAWLQAYAEEAEMAGMEDVFKVLERAAEAVRDAAQLLNDTEERKHHGYSE